MVTESMNNYLEEVKERVNDLLIETGSPQLAFTQYVLDEMCEKANLGETYPCYAVIRNDSNQNVLGELYGYSISQSGETVCLFYTIYEPLTNNEPYAVPADKYNLAINRLQGYYLAAVQGRCNEMEPSSEDYKICKYIYENEDDITNVRLFVLTNGTIKSNLKTPKKRLADQKLLSFISWDINRLYTNLHSASDHVSVDIDLLDDPDYNFKIPFIEMKSEVEQYETYIAMLPGEFLYNLYENHNTDLLQSNVRFFKGKKGCNKGIFETLKSKPHRFLAYNDGLTATASAVLADFNEDKQTGQLKFIENFQILNGGQTTASIYYAKKENDALDLSKVYVQMKLIVLQDNIEEFHPLITRYSNTQSNITPSDYSTNTPFNHKLQELSRSIIAPDILQSGNVVHWYYERVSGQYDQDVNRLKTKAEKDKFKSENPSDKKFDKKDLGRIYTAWHQQPDVSILGPQKCYPAFIKQHEDVVPDNIFFEDFVAMVILFRYMEKKNPVFLEFHQLKAQMTVYTLAMLYHVTNGNISLYKIWQNQGLSDNLKSFINELAKQLYEKLSADKPDTITFRDFCKSAKTWEAAKKYTFSLDIASIVDDFKSRNEDAARKEAGKSITEKERKEVEKYGAQFWDGLSRLGTDLYTELEYKTMGQIVSALVSNKQLSPVLIFEGQQLIKKFEESSIAKEEVIAKSTIKPSRKEKDSTALFKRIQKLTEDDWIKIRMLVGRCCDESDTKIVKKIASQKDRSKLTFKQLSVICRALDQINEKFKDKIKVAF